MGIGNTTASSALAAVFTGAPPEEVTGRGTGIDDATFRRKVDVVAARARGEPTRSRGRASTCWRRSAASRSPAWRASCWAPPRRACRSSSTASSPSVAALAAVRLAPSAAGYLIASHRSVEAGHRLVLKALGKRAAPGSRSAPRRRHGRRAGDAAGRRGGRDLGRDGDVRVGRRQRRRQVSIGRSGTTRPYTAPTIPFFIANIAAPARVVTPIFS